MGLVAYVSCVAWCAVLVLVLFGGSALKVDGGVYPKHGYRHLQSLLPSSPYFFDALRNNLLQWDGNATKAENSSIYKVAFLLDDISTTYRLAEIKSFLPFSKDGVIQVGNWNEGFGVLLALHHLNQMTDAGHPVLREFVSSDPVLSNCDIRFTIELFDGQFDAGVTTRTISLADRKTDSFSSPPISAVLGAHYSSETLPLAIFTGVNGIPQISASATTVDLDNKEQYPLFGRTVTSTDGEATVAVRFFQSVKSTHVAILYVTDPYVDALHKAFVEEAAKVGIMTESLVYSDTATEQDLRDIMAWLKRLQYRHVFSICFEDKLEPIMNAAVEMGTVGPEYLYVFPSFDVFILQGTLRIKDGSPLSRGLHGVGLIQMQGTVSRERYVIGKEKKAPTLNEESTAGFDRFRVAWARALDDLEFVKYVQSKLPATLDNATGFDRGANFTNDPHGFLNFNYDAVTSLGLAMCHAGENTTFFTGNDIYREFLGSNFEGASGEVRIIPETGTRHHTTITFVLWNVRLIGVDSEGYSIIEYAPSFRFSDDVWNEIPGNTYEFADGTTSIPNPLPAVSFDYNYIGSLGRAIAYTLMGIVMVCSLASIAWTLFNLDSHVVDSAQPLFLTSISVGAFVMASSILPLGFDEEITETLRSLDTACMAVPWLYFLGTSISLSGLMAKTDAVHQAYMNPDLEEIQVTPYDIFRFGIVLITVTVLSLAIWSGVSPLQWTRIESDKTDIYRRALESTAICESTHATWFTVVVIGVNWSFLVLGTVWAYRIRNIATEYNESRYIGLAIAAVLQLWSMGIPVLIAVEPYPAASFFVKTGLVILSSVAVLAFVFIPKILLQRSAKRQGTGIAGQIYTASFVYASNRKNARSETEESPGTEPQDVPSRKRLALNGRVLKIVHNPRSPKNLVLGGGHELSKAQLKLFRRSEASSSSEHKVSPLSTNCSLHQNKAELQPTQDLRQASERSLEELSQVAEDAGDSCTP